MSRLILRSVYAAEFLHIIRYHLAVYGSSIHPAHIVAYCRLMAVLSIPLSAFHPGYQPRDSIHRQARCKYLVCGLQKIYASRCYTQLLQISKIISHGDRDVRTHSTDGLFRRLRSQRLRLSLLALVLAFPCHVGTLHSLP